MSDERETRDPFAEAGKTQPTYRRYLTPAECRVLGLPYGTEGQIDEHGNLVDVPAETQQAQAETQQACNAAALGQHQPGYLGYAQVQPEASLRMNCLQMALYVADGAPPLPLGEVIERARAYWRFVQLGE